MQIQSDTITAIATPPGKGGVGIVRVSGPLAKIIAETLIGFSPTSRHAHFCEIRDQNANLLDEGIVIFFPGPNSFTGEDVLEIQGHGGPIILDSIVNVVLELGARMAKPGEFSERAFLNDKLDLAQAEAIADLIDSASTQAAKNALRSLKGEFSAAIDTLVEQLIGLRMYVEAAIDFPEEEIDFLSDGKVAADLQQITESLNTVFEKAKQGSILREGMQVVIAGPPNAGKSSLLNALAGKDSAIVTDIAGTTRDVLREHIHIDGLPLHIIDTAGLRESPDTVEQEGIRRAWREIEQADEILLVVDSNVTRSTQPEKIWPQFIDKLADTSHISVIQNKCDLSGIPPGYQTANAPHTVIAISAQAGLGIDTLKDHLKRAIGYKDNIEGSFSARRRHLEALEQARRYLRNGSEQLNQHGAGELLAEDLRLCQQALGEITGSFSNDDLLGKIFSSFCIGK